MYCCLFSVLFEEQVLFPCPDSSGSVGHGMSVSSTSRLEGRLCDAYYRVLKNKSFGSKCVSGSFVSRFLKPFSCQLYLGLPSSDWTGQ